MKIYFDCTFTYHSGLNTGIQRVVRNIIARDLLYKQKFNVDSQPVINFNGTYYKIDRAFVLDVKPVTASIGQKIKNAFDRTRNITLKNFIYNSNFYKLLVFIFNILEWFLKKLFWIIKGLRVVRTIIISGFKKVHFKPEDKLVLLDAFWTYDIGRALDNASLTKEQIFSVIYDLIPANYPHYVEEIDNMRFMKMLPKLIKRVQNFIGISRSVALELNEFLKLEKTDFVHKTDYFHLGSDFKPKEKNGQFFLRPSYSEVFSEDPVWLVVGTIEPRKNHTFILNTFEKMWSNGARDKLLIIGRIGWKCDEILARIQNHPKLNDRLFFYSDGSDDELLYAYKNSEGLIFASYVEGFGLPIVEAMASGIKVICSQIPVFKEVGGSYPYYFELDNPESLVEQINALRGKPLKERQYWINWDQAAEIFIQKIIRE